MDLCETSTSTVTREECSLQYAMLTVSNLFTWLWAYLSGAVSWYQKLLTIDCKGPQGIGARGSVPSFLHVLKQNPFGQESCQQIC